MKTFLQKLLLQSTFLLLFIALSFNSNAQVVTNFSASGTWTCPAGVTSIKVECWGGGGAGGGGTVANTYAGGGGGGAFNVNNAVAVIPGTNYTITVGTGAVGTLISGTAGGNSIFGSSLVIANGGAGGITVAGGVGAGGAGGTGGTFNGGNGSAGAGTSSGAGGGGAGSTSAGGNASGITAGAAGGTDGSAGGAGRTSSAAGNPAASSATTFGGGGGGAKAGAASTRLGGNGANGFVRVTYLTPCITPVAQPTSLVLMPGGTSISGSFTASAGTNAYLIIRTSTSTAPSNPVNGTTYTVGAAALGGIIESIGSGTTFNSTGLATTTQYWYWIYAYNFSLCSGGPVYNTTSPLTGTSTTIVCGIINSVMLTNTSSATLTWSSLPWSLGHLPTACESALITLNRPSGTTAIAVKINLDVNISVINFTMINASVATGRTVFDTDGLSIVNITGDITMVSPGAHKFNRTVYGNEGSTTIYGDVILGRLSPGPTDGHAAIGSTGSAAVQQYTMYGNFIFNPRGYTTDERAVFNFNKAGTQYITNNTLVTDTTQPVLFETLNIGTTNATTVIMNGTAFDAFIENVRAAGVTIGVNSTLDIPAGYSMTKLVGGATEPINMLAGSRLRLGGDKSIDRDGNIIGVAGSNFPGTFTPLNFNATSTVEYYGNNAITQTIYNVPSYANLIASNGSGLGIGRAQKNTTGPLTVITSFSINGSADVTLGTIGSSTFTVNTSGPIAVAGGANTANAGGLYCNANVISGAGSFSMGNFSTLGSGHVQGIATSGATGNLQVTGTRTLNSAGNYVYNGLVNQIVGAGIPGATNDFIIDNSGTVTTAANRLVRGVTFLKQGTFDIGTTIHTCENTGTMTSTGGRMKADLGTVQMKGNTGIAQNLSGSWFVNKTINTLINANTVGISVAASPADTLLISNAMLYGVGTINSQINTGNNVTLLSRATQTARFGEIVAGSGNSITGNVTVERFIPNTRKWRLLAWPTNSTQTARQSWMENAAVANANPKPGYGAIVTDEQASWSVNGFDSKSLSGPSVKYYDAIAGAFVGIPNTNSYAMSSNSAYYTYIRGNRTSLPSPVTFSNTVLRATGTLYTGNVVYPVADGKFVAVGNPYASAIDVRKITPVNLTTEYYVWDPKLAGAYGLGAYQLLYKSGTEYRVTPGGGSYPAAGSIVDTLESGQALMVRSNGTGAGSLSFGEDAKTVGARTFTRGAGTAQAEVIFALLNIVDPGANTLVDGAMAAFDNSYSSNVDFDDALKLTNTSENISFKRNNTLLAIERRSDVVVDDTLHLNMTGLRIKTYQWDINIANMVNPGRTAMLVDKFTNTTTNLDLTSVTNVQFAVTSTAASYAANRFMIVFKQIPMPTTQFTTISAVRNANKTIKVNYAVANEANIANYSIEQSNNGTTFTVIGTQAAIANNSGNPVYSFTDNNASINNNWYRIKFTTTAGVTVYSAIAMVGAEVAEANVVAASKISVYPNPVVGGNVNVHLDNVAKGNYTAQITNTAGQAIKTATIQVNTNAVLQTIKIGNVASGSYHVTILDETGTKTTLPFIVK